MDNGNGKKDFTARVINVLILCAVLIGYSFAVDTRMETKIDKFEKRIFYDLTSVRKIENQLARLQERVDLANSKIDELKIDLRACHCNR